MKGKTIIRIAVLGGLAYGLYRLYNSMGGSELIEDIRSDIRRDLEGLREDIADLKDDISETIGLPNPVDTLSPDEFREQSGLNIALEALDPRVRPYEIESDHPTVYGVAGITDSDNLDYEFRFTAEDNEEDISGMYYSWTQVLEYPSDDPDCTVYLNDEGQGLCRWDDGERKYTLSMTEGASLVKLVWMKKKIMSLVG